MDLECLTLRESSNLRKKKLDILPPRQMVPYTAYMSTWKQMKCRYSVAL